MIVGFADEDVDAADRDDGAAIGTYLSRNPELVVRDDRAVAGIEDAPDGDGVADACEGGSCLDPCSKRLSPHGGRQLSLRIRRVLHGGYLTEERESRA